tara:strand:+ start:20 stop:1714 length:1695 start_codon:yes stop_codon:yes gene_type:complete
MDEEEELENTLIGQEEEAPAMDTGDALMGKPSFLPYADDVAPSRVNALSVFTPGGDLKPGIDVNAITPSPTTLPAPSAVNDALPQASEQLPQALPAVATDQPQAVVSPFLQSPDTPSGLGGPLLRGFEMVNDAARGPNAPMGQEATRARLGGMTLNEYLNAPAGTPGVSGLRTDPQGRMITPAAPATVNNFAPQTPSVRATPAPFPDTGRGEIRDMLFRGPPSARPLPNDPQGFGTRPLPNDLASTRPNVDPGFIQQPSLRDPDEGFTPRPPSLREPDAGFIRPAPNLSDFERDSLARQIAIGGTGSFAGDSAAREARLDARPSFNEVRRDSDGRGGQLSQADLRDLAQGTDPNASEGQRMRALEIQQRAGLGQFKPEKELTDLEKREIESRIRGREADIARGETKSGFQPRLIDVGGERAMELSPGYFQRIPKDTPEKTGLQATLENLQSDLDSGRLTQEEYDIATRNATDLYIGREKPKGQNSSSEFENIIKGASAGDAPTVDATDAPQVETGRGQARRGRPIEKDGSTSQAPVTINSQAEYDALPAGTPYIDSQGTPGTKK